MMFLPFNGNALLIVMRTISRPATLAEIAFRMSFKYPNQTQDNIIDAVAFLLKVGWLNTMIIEQGGRYSLSENVYSMVLNDLPPPTPFVLAAALKNFSLMQLMGPLMNASSANEELMSIASGSGSDEFDQYEEYDLERGLFSRHSSSTLYLTSHAEDSEELEADDVEYVTADEDEQEEEQIDTELESERYVTDEDAEDADGFDSAASLDTV